MLDAYMHILSHTHINFLYIRCMAFLHAPAIFLLHPTCINVFVQYAFHGTCSRTFLTVSSTLRLLYCNLDPKTTPDLCVMVGPLLNYSFQCSHYLFNCVISQTSKSNHYTLLIILAKCLEIIPLLTNPEQFQLFKSSPRSLL